MSNSFGSLHIRKKRGNLGFWPKKRVFRGKTGFYLPVPVKTEVYLQTRQISMVWRYRVYIYIYIERERESLIQHWQVYVAFPHLGIGKDWASLEHRLLVECIRYQYEAHSL